MKEVYVYSFHTQEITLTFESLLRDIFHLGRTHPQHKMTTVIDEKNELIRLELVPNEIIPLPN